MSIRGPPERWASVTRPAAIISTTAAARWGRFYKGGAEFFQVGADRKVGSILQKGGGWIFTSWQLVF
jgi:hypothetical protein